MKKTIVTRRQFLSEAREVSVLSAFAFLLPNYAWSEVTKVPQVANGAIDLTIARTPFTINGKTGSAVTVNGTVPGPLLRFREGQEAVIRVKNNLQEATSIHWHGVLVPPEMDGVPGVSFRGIQPGDTFTYRFPVTQSGTYWYHSHSGGQELEGMYGPIVIDPIKPDPVSFERDYVSAADDFSQLVELWVVNSHSRPQSRLAKSGHGFGKFWVTIV